MNKLLILLASLAVLPVYAADPYAAPAAAGPAAAEQPAANTPVTAQPTTEPAAQAKPKSTGIVARAQFTSAIQDREPVDKVTNLTNDQHRVYFFSEIKDAADQKITHRWEHAGKVVSETSFDIGGDRWRVYSNKTLDPQLTGEWKVSVVDEAGGTLGVSTFTYEIAKAAIPSQSEAPAAASQPAAAPQKP